MAESPAERVVAIVNPWASHGAAKKRWPKIEAALREHWPALEARLTEARGHATALAREELEAGADMVISVGGDGTNNEVLAGFLDASGVNRFPDAVLGVVANGTGGDFQRMFGQRPPLQQVARMAAAPVRSIDYGLVHFVDHEGQPQRRPFLNMVSVGISGLVDAIVNQSGRPLGSTAAYVSAALRAISRWQNLPVSMRIDDEPARDLDLTLLCVGNGQYFGAGMWACPDASLDNGHLELVLLEGFSKGQLVGALGRSFKGKHIGYHGITARPAGRVVVEARHGAEVLLDLDGEQPGQLPATIEIVRAGLRLRLA
ncbi:MAG: diacylglycerol kinase family lipid kinase [Myxococcales bacterium]|nr:diacylglycerol kinase family lipid kinase [Myxococcales bacterium]